MHKGFESQHHQELLPGVYLQENCISYSVPYPSAWFGRTDSVLSLFLAVCWYRSWDVVYHSRRKTLTIDHANWMKPPYIVSATVKDTVLIWYLNTGAENVLVMFNGLSGLLACNHPDIKLSLIHI